MGNIRLNVFGGEKAAYSMTTIMGQSINFVALRSAARVLTCQRSLAVPHFVIKGVCSLSSRKATIATLNVSSQSCQSCVRYQELFPLCADINDIDFRKLRTLGIRAIAFDKDNVLTAPYKNSIYPTIKVSVLFVVGRCFPRHVLCV